MADVAVTRKEETDDAFTFDVRIDAAGSSTRHVVTLSRSDYEGQAGRWPAPERFVAHCFEFLLEREPKESILGRFDVRDIERYFPEFGRDVLRAEA